jgi:PAS domain S-box-containing protein
MMETALLPDLEEVTQSRLESLISASPAVLYGLKKEGEALVPFWVSENITRLMGYQPEECLNDPKWWFTGVHPDDREAALARIPTLFAQGHLVHEYRFRHKDGQYFWVRDELRISGVRPGRGQEIAGAWLEITERKRAEEETRRLNEALEQRVEERTAELRDSEARLRSFIENAPMDIYLKGLDGRHILVGPQAGRIYGVSADEFLGKRLDEMPSLQNKAFTKAFLSMEQEVLETGQPVQSEAEIILEEGLHTVVNTKFPVRNTHGEIIATGGVAFDITERKRLEQELLHQERLATLGKLTATVSHELRNPLGVIRTSAFGLGQELKKTTSRARRSLERIERSVIRCDRIIDEILDFTRIQDIELGSTPLDAWLEETLNEQTLPSDVILRSDSGMPGRVVPLDRDRFRRAIVNVFDNACQAMTGDGMEAVSSEQRVLTVRTQERDGRAEVIFEDTGPGIPPDVYGRIFEPLFSTKGFGVGLGLPAVQQIMEQHGGGIEIDSEEGRGTRVCLWLPSGDSNDQANSHTDR